MKVILLQDVAKIGRRYAVAEVPDGFARNKLIPMKAALPATPENLARYRAQRERVEASKQASAAAVAEGLAQLAVAGVVVAAEANAQGHLFKQVSAKEIAAATAAAGSALPETAIEIASPIKSVGVHVVTVVQGTTRGELTVTVTAR